MVTCGFLDHRVVCNSSQTVFLDESNTVSGTSLSKIRRFRTGDVIHMISASSAAPSAVAKPRWAGMIGPGVTP